MNDIRECLLEREYGSHQKRHIFIIVAGFYIMCCMMRDGLEIAMAAGMIFTVVALAMRFSISSYTQPRLTLYLLWVLLFWGYFCLSAVFITVYRIGYKSIAVYLLPVFPVALYFSPQKNTDKLFNTFCKGCIYSTIILIGYIAVKEMNSIISGGITRIGNSASGNVNTVAMSLCTFLIVIFYKLTFEKQRNLLPLFFLSLFFILLTGSKKGLLGILIVVLVMSLFRYKWRVYKYIIPIAILLSIIYLINNNEYFYEIIGRRVDDFFKALKVSQENGSTGERIGMYRYSWKFFINSPIFGNGYGYFAANTPFHTYSHSNYSEILVSFGLIGFVLYYWYYIKVMVTAFKQLHTNPAARVFLTFIILQLFFDSAAIGFYSNALMYAMMFFAKKFVLEPRITTQLTEEGTEQ